MKTTKVISAGWRIFQILSVICILQAVIAGAVTNRTDKQLVLRVGYLPVLSQLPLVVSYDRDRYSYRNIGVKLTGFKSYIALEAAFRVSAIDVAYLPIPTILAMKADGVDLLIGDSLHRGGFSFVLRDRSKGKIDGDEIFGIPGLSSNAQLMLHDYLIGSRLNYGKDYKTVTVQLSDAVVAIQRQQVDGLLLPEPYPTKVIMQVPGVMRLLQVKQANQEMPQSALVFNWAKVVGNTQGIMEWLGSIEKACHTLQEDIMQFGGAQTVLTQQHYFNFEMALMREALSHSRTSLVFGPEEIKKDALKAVVERMIAEKLLLNSLNFDDALLSSYLPSQIMNERENEN